MFTPILSDLRMISHSFLCIKSLRVSGSNVAGKQYIFQSLLARGQPNIHFYNRGGPGQRQTKIPPTCIQGSPGQGPTKRPLLQLRRPWPGTNQNSTYLHPREPWPGTNQTSTSNNLGGPWPGTNQTSTSTTQGAVLE